MSVSSIQVEVDWRSRLQRVVDKVVKVVKDSQVHLKETLQYLDSASAKEAKDDCCDA